MKLKKILGIDVGGSGIKGAIVHTKKGKFITERYRIPTPEHAKPQDVAIVIKKIAEHFKWKGSIGCGFPAVVQNGIARTASNIDDSFIDTDVNSLFTAITKCPTFAVNDADAAGLAEMKFGAGKGKKGVIVLVTVGTGIGTVVFTRKKLLPNTELGHVYMSNCLEAEAYTSDAIRKLEDLSWDDWSTRFNDYLKYLEGLLWPDLIIVGGGVSKKEKKYQENITIKTRIVPAQLLNNAGIIGAALFAKQSIKTLLKEKDTAIS